MNRIFYWALILMALLVGCRSNNCLKVEETGFDVVISPHQNLIFRFNHPVVSDSLINVWHQADYLVFDPAVNGQYKWQSTDELVFSPTGGFAAATKYSIHTTKNILPSDKDYGFDQQSFEVNTAELTFSAFCSWGVSVAHNNRPEARVTLEFSAPVNESELFQHLQMKLDDTEVQPVFLKSVDQTKYFYAIPVAKKEGVSKIDVTILHGLNAEGGNIALKKELNTTVILPAMGNIMITQMNRDANQPGGVIVIHTSQPVINRQLEGMVSVDPYVQVTIENSAEGLLLKGDFLAGTTYQIMVSPELQGAFGEVMGKEYSQYVSFGEMKPDIAFDDDRGLYLTGKGNKNLSVRITNIAKVRVRVFKIFENNVLHYLRQGKKWDYSWKDDEYHEFYEYPFDENYGKVVMDSVVDRAQMGKLGNSALLHLNPDNFDTNGKGVYIVDVSHAEKLWIRDRMMVSVSDIGLMVRKGKNSLAVFVNSLRHAEPMNGVELSLVSRNNQVVYTGKTNGQGVMQVDNLDEITGGTEVVMILAAKGTDYNYLWLRQARVNTSRYDVDGRYINGQPYDGFIYGERDLFRPGDSTHFNAIVRTPQWELVKGIPVKYHVRMPDGRLFKSFRVLLDEQGAAPVSFLLPVQAMTGSWVLELLSGNDLLLQTYTFHVEEFMPDRIKLTANCDKENYDPGDLAKISLQADNLFGTPAANRKYEVEMQLRQSLFHPKEFDDYQFGIETSSQRSFKNYFNEGRTGDKGEATIQFTLPDYEYVGMIDGTIYSTVFDETGRAVNRINKIKVQTQPHFYGIRLADYFVSTHKPLPVQFVAVNGEGKALNNVPAHVEVYRIHWETVIERSGNSYRYKSERREVLVKTYKLMLDGKSNGVNFTPEKSGAYEIRVSDGVHEAWVQAGFYAYGMADTEFSSFKVDREGRVDIVADKAECEPGDNVRLLFKAPFSGKLLVTIEQDKVLSYQTLDLKDKSATLKLKIKDAFLPNVYVTATAFRPMDNLSIPLTVAHGFTSLKVDAPARKLKVSIDAVEKSRSKTKQTIRVKTEPGTHITLAVVDEGILQISRYATPDPYAWFYGKRALQTEPFDIYALLFPEVSDGKSSAGGGAGFELGRRINPMANKRVKLVSVWSGLLTADKKGRAAFDIDLPQFSGALRVMAVAWKGNRFGNAQHIMRVADPIVVSTGVPRFLSPGDKAVLPVTLTNTTDKKSKAKVTIAMNGAIKSVGATSQTRNILPKGEVQVNFDAEALVQTGEASVLVTVKALGEKFTQKTELPVRPAAGLSNWSGSGVVQQGDTVTLKVPDLILPVSEKSLLTAGNFPVALAASDLVELIRYPYGCLEQTVSSAFPQLYLHTLLESMALHVDIPANPAYHVQEAVNKITAMQRYDGSFTYWSGSGNVNEWATVYATHFLYEANIAGYTVQKKVLEKAMKYITSLARNKTYFEYNFRDGNGKDRKIKVVSPEIPYALFVLATSGYPERAMMNYYRQRVDEMNDEGRWFLSASLAMVGDKQAATELIPKKWRATQHYVEQSGSFTSPLRATALALYTQLIVDNASAQVNTLVTDLAALHAAKKWHSTQESAFTLLALGKMAQVSGSSPAQYTLLIDGEVIRQQKVKGLQATPEAMANKRVQLVCQNGTLYFNWQVSGIKADGNVPQHDNLLRVRRQVYNRMGQPASLSSLHAGDLLFVRLRVEAPDDSRIENVAITDVLPACFEIENPRLVSSRSYEWQGDVSYPQYTDIRDDRISLFDDVYGKQEYVYSVRVVSKGDYVWGNVTAGAMYDGRYHSAWGQRRVVVK